MSNEINVNAGNVSSIGLRTQISNVATPSSGVRIFDKASGIYFVDVSGTVSGPIGAFFSPGGRISMVSGTAVTTTDIYSGTSLWYNPYQHDMLPLWDGSKIVPVQFSPTQISLSGLSGTSCFDLFTYLNGSSAAFEIVMWTSPTVRSTNISIQNGRYCKVGDATRLYLGSFYTSSAGKTSDGIRNRFIFNYYNRIKRRLYDSNLTSHNYSSNVVRSWNNDTTIRVEFITGISEDIINGFIANYGNADADGRLQQASIGLDSTSTTSIISVTIGVQQAMIISSNQSIDPPNVGYHFIQALESVASNNQCTYAGIFYGADILM